MCRGASQAEQRANDRSVEDDRLILAGLCLFEHHGHVRVGLAHAAVVGQDDVAAAEPKHLAAAQVAVEAQQHRHCCSAPSSARQRAGEDDGELPRERWVRRLCPVAVPTLEALPCLREVLLELRAEEDCCMQCLARGVEGSKSIEHVLKVHCKLPVDGSCRRAHELLLCELSMREELVEAGGVLLKGGVFDGEVLQWKALACVFLCDRGSRSCPRVATHLLGPLQGEVE
jgi:hypothetical protein